MTLLVTVFAAIVCTILWYRRKNDEMRLGTLCFMFWGASLMWLGDAIWEYAELHEEFLAPDPADMLNALFLGLSVIALAMILWLIILLIKDPKGTVRKALRKKASAAEK